MKWKRGYRSENVEDRRRVGAGAAAVGGGGIIAVLLALFFGGGGGDGGGLDLESILGSLGQAPQGNVQAPERPEGTDPDEDLRSISEFTLDDVQALWTELFAGGDSQYPNATMVLFTGSTNSACGGATSAIGPHYCPLDQTVYIDLDFFRQLETRFGAAGDFAEAYVIAHEIGHHVQNVTGIMDEVRRVQQSRPADANEYSVRLELQADCLAGVWARSAYQDNLLETGDLEEAIGAAEAVGDDRIQQQAGGMVNPETWTHGSAAQRVEWFRVGFDTGDPNTCDTFSADV
jgi:predicted metalloprotease